MTTCRSADGPRLVLWNISIGSHRICPPLRDHGFIVEEPFAGAILFCGEKSGKRSLPVAAFRILAMSFVCRAILLRRIILCSIWKVY